MHATRLWWTLKKPGLYFKKKGGEKKEQITFKPVAHGSDSAGKGMACSVLGFISKMLLQSLNVFRLLFLERASPNPNPNPNPQNNGFPR